MSKSYLAIHLTKYILSCLYLRILPETKEQRKKKVTDNPCNWPVKQRLLIKKKIKYNLHGILFLYLTLYFSFLLTGYILLENLASKFKRPSILDLKIGTRGYGDDVTEEKRLAHLAKAKLSTAGTLGVRIGGMQVSKTPLPN